MKTSRSSVVTGRTLNERRIDRRKRKESATGSRSWFIFRGPLKLTMKESSAHEQSNGVRILGVEFFNGPASGAVELMTRHGGFLAAPSAPGMVRLSYDKPYRDAMLTADLVIADSGLMVLSWRLLRGERITKNSGLSYLKKLLSLPEIGDPGKLFLVLPNQKAQAKAISYLSRKRIPVSSENCYIAPQYGVKIEDPALAQIVDQRRPAHILIGIGSGPQEKLGCYLRNHLPYRPAIHCIGAALGFLTGDQIAIPDWVDRCYLGWFLRLLAQPRLFFPRLWRASALPVLILKYGEKLPLLR